MSSGLKTSAKTNEPCWQRIGKHCKSRKIVRQAYHPKANQNLPDMGTRNNPKGGGGRRLTFYDAIVHQVP